MTELPTFTFTVGSDPDRDDLVADLICNGIVWAEINTEQGGLEIEIYSNPDGRPWCFPLERMLEVITAARARLEELGRDRLQS
jgi:hypothetical protein